MKQLVDLSLPSFPPSVFPSCGSVIYLPIHPLFHLSSVHVSAHLSRKITFPALYTTTLLQRCDRCSERYLRRKHILIKILHRNSWWGNKPIYNRAMNTRRKGKAPNMGVMQGEYKTREWGALVAIVRGGSWKRSAPPGFGKDYWKVLIANKAL